MSFSSYDPNKYDASNYETVLTYLRRGNRSEQSDSDYSRFNNQWDVALKAWNSKTPEQRAEETRQQKQKDVDFDTRYKREQQEAKAKRAEEKLMRDQQQMQQQQQQQQQQMQQQQQPQPQPQTTSPYTNGTEAVVVVVQESKPAVFGYLFAFGIFLLLIAILFLIFSPRRALCFSFGLAIVALICIIISLCRY